ncbi:MAG: ribosome maturation factor RimP [Acidobacteriota bacterium]
MSSPTIDSDLRAEIASVAETVDCELLHVSFTHGTLRVILDRPNEDVTIDHCTSVSRQLSALLDVHDFGRGRYTLEVTSPGLDRELYSERDYERFVGRLARVTYRTAEDAKVTVTGRLTRYVAARESKDAHVELTDEPSGGSGRAQTYSIPLRDVHKARLEVEL